jgi:hypothetical protein
MATRAIMRGAAAGAATTFALGALAFLGAGTAAAAPGSIIWDDGSSHFTRTISNTTPDAGETITVTTKFERTSWVDEYIYNVKDRLRLRPRVLGHHRLGRPEPPRLPSVAHLQRPLQGRKRLRPRHRTGDRHGLRRIPR